MSNDGVRSGRVAQKLRESSWSSDTKGKIQNSFSLAGGDGSCWNFFSEPEPEPSKAASLAAVLIFKPFSISKVFQLVTRN